MSGRSLILSAFFCLILLSACGGSGGSDISDAVEAGIMMPFEDVFDEEQNFQVAEASVQEFIVQRSLTAWRTTPVTRSLNFENEQGELEIFIEWGHTFSEGDVLARLTFDTEAIEIDHDMARQRLVQFEENFSAELENRQMQIAAAHTALAASDEADWRRASLELARLEIGLERFLFNSNATRRQIREEIESLAEKIGGEEIVAPFDGIVIFVIDGQDRDDLTDNPTILWVADTSVFYFSFSAPSGGSPDPAIRFDMVGYGAVLTLTSSDRRRDDDGEFVPLLEFEARVVTDAWAAGARDSFVYWLVPVDPEGLLEALEEVDISYMTFRPPDDNPINALLYMSFGVQFDVPLAPSGVAVPNAAVQQEHGMGYTRNFVYVYNDDRLGKRYVAAGVSSGGFTQIISGIEPGDLVVILR